jgi:intraflagellar transport protein 74
MRPGSAMRPGTGSLRGSTAAAPPGALGMVQRSGAGGEPLALAARPTTQQGLAGRRGATSGGGRQVQDASYFAGLLRSRVTEISQEIARMRGEAERSARDASLTVQLERRWEGAVKEVRALEGDLADYNLAMDKARTNVEAAEIQAQLALLRRRNEANTRDVDSVFIERQERERGVARLEEAIAALTRAAEERIASLPPAEAAEYRKLQVESGALQREVERRQGELEQVSAAVEAAEEALRRERTRDEYAAGEKRLALLGSELASLQDELATSRLDPTAAREKLLAKVKGENARMQAIDRQVKEEEEGAAAGRRALAELDREIEERRGEAGDSAKYEALFKRDAEMTEFIDRFPEHREREVGEQRRLQDSILALLEHASEGLLREANLPSRAAAEEMKEDLSDKQRELRASEMTVEQLREHLKLRQTELEKIHRLEGNLVAELRGLGERMEAMARERPKFADLAGLRAAADAARDALRGAIEGHIAARDAARGPAAAAEREVERARQALAALPQAAALEAAEGALKAAEATVFGLKECAWGGGGGWRGGEGEWGGRGARCFYAPLAPSLSPFFCTRTSRFHTFTHALPASLGAMADIATAGKDSDFEPVREEVRRTLTELNLMRVRRCIDDAEGVGGSRGF